MDAIEGKLDALNLSNLDDTVTSRATQTSVDALKTMADTAAMLDVDRDLAIAALKAKLDAQAAVIEELKDLILALPFGNAKAGGKR